MSVDRVCTEYGIASTTLQSDHLRKERLKVEHQFWRNGINKILEGFTEQDFDVAFLKFVLELDYSNISEGDKKVIFGNALKYQTLSKRAQVYLEKWLTSPPQMKKQLQSNVKEILDNRPFARTQDGSKPTQDQKAHTKLISTLQEMNRSFRPPQLDTNQQNQQTNEEKQKAKLQAELKKRALSNIKNMEILYDLDDNNEDEGRLAFIHKLESQICALLSKQHIMEQSAKSDKSQQYSEKEKKELITKIDNKLKLLVQTKNRQSAVDNY